MVSIKHTVLPALLLLAFVGYSEAIVAKCSACQAVAYEIQLRLDKEAPRNHLDMRHRITADGKRYGKVIDYKGSELRVVELLDEICKSISTKYSPVKINRTEGDGMFTRWVKVRGERYENVSQDMRPPTMEEDRRRAQLESYCGTLLDDYEDEVSDAIRGGKFDSAPVVNQLCHEMAKHCKKPVTPREFPPPHELSEEQQVARSIRPDPLPLHTKEEL